MIRPKQRQKTIAFSTIEQALVALDHGAELIVRTPGGSMMRFSDDHVAGIVKLLRSNGSLSALTASRYGAMPAGGF